MNDRSDEPALSPSEEVTVPPPVEEPSAETLAPEAMASASSDTRAPAGYVIDKELGRGGMGVVYLARSISLQRPCALKVILAGVHSGDAEVERFRTEAQAIARLQHPGIVQVFEIGEHEGKPFMALEFCAGGSLDAKLAKNPLAPREAATLVMALAEAMQAAHEAKVIHRDLKPANVLLTGSGTPKITDFGLAKKLDEQGATRTGSVMGTPSYMPPEQAEGKKQVGPTADVYALGAILYECLALRPPFRAATSLDTLLQVLTEEPVPLRQLNYQVPVDLETVCAKCLQKDPAKRYATARDLASDLGRFLNGEPIVARPVGAMERAVKWVRRNWVVSGLAAAVLLVLIAGVTVSSWFAYSAGEEAKAARKAEEVAQAETSRAGDEAKRADAEKTRAEEQLRRAEWLVYAGKLSLAQSAFAEGDGALALEHLDECQWNLRGWEHRHLWTRFKSRQTLKGHIGGVSSVVFSPDGKHIVTGSADQTAKVWDAQTGQEVLSLKGHTDRVTSVGFSPDGKRIVTGSADRTAKLWNTQTGEEVLTLKGHRSAISEVCFSPNGQRFVTGSFDKTAKVWDVQTGQMLLTLEGHSSEVSSVAFNADSKRIVTGSYGRTAKVWDAQTGQDQLTLMGHTREVTSVCFNPDGQRIVTGSFDKTAKVWDAHTGQEVLSLTGHTSEVFSVCFSPDGQRIVTGSLDRTVKLWEAQTGQNLLTLTGHTNWVRSMCFSPDGKRIVTGSHDRTAKVWDAQTGQEVLTLTGHTRGLLSVCFSADGKRLASASGAKTVKVWDALTGRQTLTLQGHTGWVPSVCFSPDGQRIVTGSGGFDNQGRPLASEAKVWDADTGQEALTLTGHSGSVSSVCFSPDGKRIVTGSHDRTAKVWDAQTGQEVLSLRYTGAVNSVCFSPDSQRIVTGNSEGTAKVWDAEKGRELLSLRVRRYDGAFGPVRGVCFRPDGKRIVTVGPTVKVWDAETDREVLTLRGHSGYVTSVAFSPDSTRIVTGSEDKTVKVWDAETGQEVLTLKGHTSAVHSVCFSSDGNRLVSGSEDGAKVWDAQNGQTTFHLKGHTWPVHRVAFSTDGNRIASTDDNVVKVWDAQKGQEILSLKGLPRVAGSVSSVAFSGDSKRVYVWDVGKKVLAWSLEDGKAVDPVDPPLMPPRGPATSPDGFFRATGNGGRILVVTDTRPVDPNSNHWPLPDRAERKRYHIEQAALAEKEKQWFAAAFHLGRLLLDDPKNAELKKRRDQALKNLAAKAVPNNKLRMEKVH